MAQYFLKILILLTLTSFFTVSNANQKILLVGDSLSAGYGLEQAQDWVHLLQNKYNNENRTITIINTAISGQTTDNALLKINTWLEVHKPTHVLIELGGNDGIRGFPVKLLQEHLLKLVTRSQEYGAKVALMEIHIPPNLGPRYRKMFTDSYSTVTSKSNAYLMPYFMLEIAVNPELMLTDNLHPNEKAQPIIRDFMFEEINKWLKL